MESSSMSVRRIDGAKEPEWITSWFAWVAAALAIFALAALGVYLRPNGSDIAVWWPAAGVSAGFVLANPRRRRWAAIGLVFVATFVANIAGGRDFDISFAFGFANAAEAGLFVWLLELGRTRFVLRTVTDAMRFVLAAIVAGTVIGVLAGLGVMLLSEGAFTSTAVQAGVSHAGAVLMIAPFAALPPRPGETTPWGEVALQSLLLITSIVVVFGVDNQLPLAFVPLAFLAWGAFRFPARFAFLQSLLTAIVVVVVSLLDSGPFDQDSLHPDEQAIVVVTFLLVLAAFTLLLVSGHTEVSLATRSAENAAQMLSSGFVDSGVALILVDDIDGEWIISWHNRAAATAIEGEVDARSRWRGQLADQARAALRCGDVLSFQHIDTRATVNVVANPVEGDARRIAVQIVDVSEAVRASEEQLEAERVRGANLEAKYELERQREDFVATTSHELRTPIVSIAGYAELLQESTTLEPTEKQWVEVIARNSDRLRELVEDLLILSRASTAPEERGVAEVIDVHAIIEDVVAIHCPLAERRSIMLEIDEVSGTVEAVRSDVTRALSNLVSNAIKFTPPGGRVSIMSSFSEASGTTLSVTDSGPGIPADALVHVFERFYRAPDAERSSTPGTGLGLSITAELAHRNGATVDLKSPEGSGVTASLRFPSALNRTGAIATVSQLDA
ncbi:ATP-binding protein (plasmid) [Coraliomargarita sp. W4R53]